MGSSVSRGRSGRRANTFKLVTDELAAKGVVRFWDAVVNLKNDGPYSWSFETDVDLVVLQEVRITSPPDKGMGHSTFELFEGGTTSGGTSKPIFKFNQNNVLDNSPLINSEIIDQVTIDVAGTSVFMANMVGFKEELFNVEQNSLILTPETKYYFTLDNIIAVSDDNELIRIMMRIVRVV